MLNQFNVSLWGDEAWAATLAVKPIFQIIKIVARDTSPPLYYLLDHLWMKIFGTNEVSIRTLSFLFFLGTVFIVYLIGKHFWDEKTGFLAASLTFTNPFLFRYAFEGRMYALLVLTTSASMYFYLKKHRLGHILTSTAALYTHHFSILAIFAQVFWHWSHNRGKSFRKTLVSFKDFLIVGLLYLPWLYPLYYQASLVGSGFWLAKPTLKTAGEVIKTFLLGQPAREIIKAPFESDLSTIKMVALISLILIIVLRNWFKKDLKTKKTPDLFFLLWFFLPILLTFIISQLFQSIFFDRYLLFVIPGALLILASNRKKFSLWFLIIFIAAMAVINFHYFTHPNKRPFRDFAFFVREKINNNDFLINDNAAAHHLFESKYYDLKAPLYIPEGNLPFYVGTALMEKEDVIREIPKNVIRLGVITSGSLEEIKIKGFEMFVSFEVDSLKFARFAPNYLD